MAQTIKNPDSLQKRLLKSFRMISMLHLKNSWEKKMCILHSENAQGQRSSSGDCLEKWPAGSIRICQVIPVRTREIDLPNNGTKLRKNMVSCPARNQKKSLRNSFSNIGTIGRRMAGHLPMKCGMIISRSSRNEEHPAFYFAASCCRLTQSR